MIIVVLSYGGGDAGRDQDQKEDDRERREDKRQGLRLVLSRDGLQPVKMLPLHLLSVMGFFQCQKPATCGAVLQVSEKVGEQRGARAPGDSAVEGLVEMHQGFDAIAIVWGHWSADSKLKSAVNSVNSDRVANLGRAPTFNDNLVDVVKIDDDTIAALVSQSRQPSLMEYA